MSELTSLSDQELHQRVEDLEYQLSGLAQMAGNVLPPRDVAELKALRAEVDRRKKPAPRK